MDLTTTQTDLGMWPGTGARAVTVAPTGAKRRDVSRVAGTSICFATRLDVNASPIHVTTRRGAPPP